MHSQLQKLRVDHANMDRLLGRFKQELNAMRFDHVADFFLMTQILDYVSHYPDQLHHPQEDVLYAQLGQRFPEHRALTATIENEHVRLEEQAKCLADMFHSVMIGQPVPRRELERVASGYVSASREHMAREQKVLFPVINSLFDARDWARVEEQLLILALPRTNIASARGFEYLLASVIASDVKSITNEISVYN